MTTQKVVCENNIDAVMAKIAIGLKEAYGANRAYAMISSVSWYVCTGLAPTEFCRLWVNATPQQIASMVKAIAKGGSDQEVVGNVCKVLHYNRVA